MSKVYENEEMTKGMFLLQKLRNMARWVEQEVGKENLPVDIIAGIADRTELEACAFAGALQANKEEVTNRNWSGLLQRVRETKEIPPAVGEVMDAIYTRNAMHDKFWRYMDLFVEVAAQ